MGLFDDLFGSSGSTKRIAESSAAQRRRIQEGQATAGADLTGARDTAINRFLEPTIARGGEAGDLEAALLGLGGDSAGAIEDIQGGAGFQAGLDQGIEAIDRSASARGLLGSGGTEKDLFSFGNRFLEDFVRDRLGRLAGLRAEGTGAAGAGARATLGTGSELAGLNFGTGQLIGNTFIDEANAIAQAKQVPINNIINSLEAAAKLAGAFTGGGGGGGDVNPPAPRVSSFQQRAPIRRDPAGRVFGGI